MSEIDDGGPAFPTAQTDAETWQTRAYPGMSLRDWFAGQALAGLIVGYTHAYGSPTSAASEMAVEAYGFADRMLAARSKRHD